MLSKVQIANNALAYLSETSIQSFNDDLDEKARVIRSVFDAVAMEVIRSHRWSCCMRRAELSRLAERPEQTREFGYSFQYQLPSDCLRLCDINGEPWSDKTEFFDLNGRQIQTNASSVLIRYVALEEDTAQWDVLLAEAVAIKLAMRISRRITKDGASGEQLYQLYKSRLAEAQHMDAMETGSGENRPLERILEQSPLVQQGRANSRFFRPAARVGIGVDFSTPR